MEGAGTTPIPSPLIDPQLRVGLNFSLFTFHFSGCRVTGMRFALISFCELTVVAAFPTNSGESLDYSLRTTIAGGMHSRIL